MIHTIKAGELQIRLSCGEHGLTVCGVRDGKTGKRMFSGNAELFSLTVRELKNPENKTVFSSSDGWERVYASKCGCVSTFALEKQGVRVILTAEAGENAVLWTVSIASENETFSLYECEYPALPADAKRNVKVFFPYGCGEVYKAEKPFETKQNYPSYGASMEYMAVWNERAGRGIYYGLHDPAPAYKKLRYRSDGKTVSLGATMPLTGIDRAKNGQMLAGSTVWRLYDGDWYDAALLYKEFFETQADWKPVMKDGKRADTPEWLRTNPHWWRKRMTWDTSFAKELTDADRALGLKKPSPVHLYDWFQIPYDTNYPHYFPAKDAFAVGMKRLREYGIRVMPYINGRLWDTHDRGKEDWQFTALAKPWCTKSAGDKPFLESYPTSKIDLAIMCPSSALWQEKMTEIIGTLFSDFGVDGVYIDQIGAAQPYPCEDKRHRHRAGGGSWWVESYRDLLGHAHRVMPEESVLTTECTSDPYMKDIQGYLSWIWIKNDQVPAFMAVYNGYVAVFGRSYDYAGDTKAKDMIAAQSLTFGEQMGWIKPEVYRAYRHKDFYGKLVKCREDIGSFLYDGKLLRSPKLIDKTHLRTTKILEEAYGGVLEHTATFSELWERKDGKKLLFLINASSRPTTVTVETGDLPDGVYAPHGELTEPVKFAHGKATVTLGALSVSWIIAE